jgi:uracil-DNA glycosylase
MAHLADMILVQLSDETDFDGWRDNARCCAEQGIAPENIIWQVGSQTGDLFAMMASASVAGGGTLTVPRRFVDLARSVICHSGPERFALLYQLLFRLRDNVHALDDRSDTLVHRLDAMAKSVRRDIHKMRAFVRFRKVERDGKDHYVAWFEPDHHIVRANAGFFMRRFATMNWSILTPELSIHWDGKAILESPGATAADAPDEDSVEDQWKAYYASTFNPARLKIGAMLREMPKKYWKNMPETALVRDLIAGAQMREAKMIETEIRISEGDAVTKWTALKKEATRCERCPLHECATQTVFGEGPLDAKLMFVGEQPGDQEDLAGRAFVGPAGQIFNETLEEAGIDRNAAYITNAVKHFKFIQRDKRRIHDKPSTGEIDICRWWLGQERAIVQPRMIVALGASAARGVIGRTTTISKVRGSAIMLDDGVEAWVTVHPSYLLRIPDIDTAQRERRRFVEDLIAIKARIARL